MLYKFIDTTEYQDEIALPSEAMNFNGVFLENEVEGYRTLYVTGRESLAPELDFYESGARHGKKIKSRMFQERVITVGYQLMSPTAFDFRMAYNKMAQILNVSSAKMVFSDEPDKYFIGTLTSMGETDPGKLCITGELEFTCPDPFKYSVDQKIYKLSGLSKIYYEGTQDCYPELRWNIKGNTGYVAAYKDSADTIIQIGNPSEAQATSNTFAADDIVVAKCEDASIFVNNKQKDTLGAIGNEWESFYLKPGDNQIGVLTSDWAQTPDIEMIIREVWL